MTFNNVSDRVSYDYIENLGRNAAPVQFAQTVNKYVGQVRKGLNEYHFKGLFQHYVGRPCVQSVQVKGKGMICVTIDAQAKADVARIHRRLRFDSLCVCVMPMDLTDEEVAFAATYLYCRRPVNPESGPNHFRSECPVFRMTVDEPNAPSPQPDISQHPITRFILSEAYPTYADPKYRASYMACQCATCHILYDMSIAREAEEAAFASLKPVAELVPTAPIQYITQ